MYFTPIARVTATDGVTALLIALINKQSKSMLKLQNPKTSLFEQEFTQEGLLSSSGKFL
ncbi:hypothetical protein [Acinetobacter sp.]|uniref:hypothetical protein n=1 Tax=Acinetobacter sp. TaxID=472 RepID=UPI0035B004FA